MLTEFEAPTDLEGVGVAVGVCPEEAVELGDAVSVEVVDGAGELVGVRD